MRVVDSGAIAEAGRVRFRSEYDYAVFEYRRSAKVIEAFERSGARLQGRVLDDGCGGGGTVVSLGEEVSFAVGLDVAPRFVGAGTRLADEERVDGVGFVQGDGGRLPFAAESFDVVFSHSVIEHLPSAEDYLAECRRVLRPGGVLYLSTAPYLSLSGAHLPRLKLPIPLHLVFGRRIAFSTFCWLAAHAPWTLQEARDANTFIRQAEAGGEKKDDLLQMVTVRRLSGWVRDAGFRTLLEERYVTGFFRRVLPGPLRRFLAARPFTQDVMIGHIQYVLEKASA